MKKTTKEIINEINTYRDEEKAVFLPRFFKTGKGEYGEGDQFIGVVVPNLRIVAKKYADTDFNTLQELLASPVHEYRMTALLALTYYYAKHKDNTSREACVNFYLSQVDAINNWDLVDLSCYKILGHWLFDKNKQILYDWARENHLWKQRIAMISCMHFVKHGEFKDALAIADILQHHSHDLIHKAVGWILREIGKENEQILTDYLIPRYKQMPRTMLRYAIERFEEEKRKAFLNSMIADSTIL